MGLFTRPSRLSFPKSLIGNPGLFKTVSPIEPSGDDKGEETMMTRLISAFCILLISATIVFADQCAWLPGYAQAGNAFMFLKEGETIYEYCAPCGETIARPVVIKQLKVRKVPIEPPHSELQGVPEYKPVAFLLRPPRSNDSQGDGNGYYEVTVNGKGIDLAYIYIPFEGGYRNLATLVGCPCEDVPVVLPEGKIGQDNKVRKGKAF